MKNQGSIFLTFTTVHDCLLFQYFKESSSRLRLSIANGTPLFEAANLPEDPHDSNGATNITLAMEDAFGANDGNPHTIAMTFGDFGTRWYLDGYQCFESATNFSPSRLGNTPCLEQGESVTDFEYYHKIISSTSLAQQTPTPIPDIYFAGPTLADRDLARLAAQKSGSLHAQFRLRGPGQHGVLFEAGIAMTPMITLHAGPEGITTTIADPQTNTRVTFTAAGNWDDGEWHDLIIRSARGAFELYMDGYSQLHHVGQFWFGDIAALCTEDGANEFCVSIGQSLQGVRLMGELRTGGIFLHPLTEGNIKRLSNTEPLETTALFDSGYANSRSYRIPSLLRTARGTLIAGADQRTVVANDAPNHINFVIRRSFDNGHTWQPMQTVIAMPDEDGRLGASAIDSCPIADPLGKRERITVLIDLNPGGIGLTNCATGFGVDEKGHIKLVDKNGGIYTASMNDEPAIDSEGKSTPWIVEANGNIRDTRAGNANNNPQCSTWNIWRYPQTADPHQPCFAMPTTYIAEIHSDDDGETWSSPQLIDHMVKEPWMQFAGVCPGNGIVLRHNQQHNGRLLIPFYCSGESRSHYSSGALISDDDGLTWRRGRMINEGRVINGKKVNPRTMHDDDATSSETVFVERKNGDVVAFFRNQHHSGKVGKAISHDGGETWDELTFDPALPEIFSQPNATPVSVSDPNRIAFINASQMMPYRGRGVIHLSDDGGETWQYSRCINPFHHVYQCMTLDGNHNLHLMWERETTGIYITTLPKRLWQTSR